MFKLLSVFYYLQKKFGLLEKMCCSLDVIDDCECLCEFSQVSVIRPCHVSATIEQI